MATRNTEPEELTIQEKVYNLYVELEQAKKDRKETVKTCREEIARIEAEITDIITQANAETVAAQKEATE